MLVIHGRDVNELWHRGVNLMITHGIREPSRNGPALVAPYPVMSVYENPCNRVLFDPARDANPFFHFFEALWMLAGREDAEFLNRFVKDFGERFAQSDGRIHGAYGHRWRHGFGVDQLDAVVDKLRKNPQDRQCVIQMWGCDTFGDLLTEHLKDRPCNTHIYLRVRDTQWELGPVPMGGPVLDLTVCCRSNDIVWGAYGANAVHFSFLQEYLAGRIGVGVGKLYQFSNNWHAYEDVLTKYLEKAKHQPDNAMFAYDGTEVTATPIGAWHSWNHWDMDLEKFMAWAEDGTTRQLGVVWYANAWFRYVAEPMFAAHAAYKNQYIEGAFNILQSVVALDWQRAAREWIERRMK